MTKFNELSAKQGCSLFSFAALAFATLIAVTNNANAVAGDVGTGKVINTSPLYADSGISYHAFNINTIIGKPDMG